MLDVADQEPVPPPVMPLPGGDPVFRDNPVEEARFGRFRRGAIIAAALFHLLLLAAILFGLPLFSVPVTPPPPAIPVALVNEIPKPPPPPEAPPKPTPPAQQHFYDLRSGADQETTVKPQGEVKAEDAAPKAEPPPPTAAEAPEPSPPKPAHPTLAQPKPKEAERESTPKPAQKETLNIRVGEKDQEGDPYLNALKARIAEHYRYPADAVGSFGLHLAGTVVYSILISENGALQGARLDRSSGSPVLDETALRAIEQSAPFPPLPNSYPRSGVVLTWTMEIYPSGP
jgi:periplasmic protein TonB